jgi:microcystin-dependent protein
MPPPFKGIQQSLSEQWFLFVTVAAIFFVAAMAWLFLPSPILGTVYAAMYNEGGRVAPFSFTLPDLATSTASSLYTSEGVTTFANIPSPDSAGNVSLTHNQRDSWQVTIVANGADRTVPLHGAVPEVPSWSPDSKTISFAALAATTSDDTGNPDEWLVVRAVLNGDSLVVGHGYHPIPSFDGRVYALTSRGVELLSHEGEEGEVVIASAVPVHISTPFAVSQDGTRVAWVNPADRSLQVFEHVNEYFVPLLLKPGASLQSMVFSPDGRYLLAAIQNETQTKLVSIKVDGGTERKIGVLDGSVTLHAWRYE